MGTANRGWPENGLDPQGGHRQATSLALHPPGALVTSNTRSLAGAQTTETKVEKKRPGSQQSRTSWEDQQGGRLLRDINSFLYTITEIHTQAAPPNPGAVPDTCLSPAGGMMCHRAQVNRVLT